MTLLPTTLSPPSFSFHISFSYSSSLLTLTSLSRFLLEKTISSVFLTRFISHFSLFASLSNSSYPLFRSWWSFWLLVLLLVSTPCRGFGDGFSSGGRGGPGPGAGAQCQVEACTMAPLEGDPPSESHGAPKHGAGGTLPTTQLPSRPIKVSCHPPPGTRISSLDSLCLQQLPVNTRALEISNLTLSRLDRGSFPINLSQLRKLDLQGNAISEIEPGAFEHLANLKRLDLSGNRITSLNGLQLAGLRQLVRIKVGHNPLKNLVEDLIEELPSLKAIELTEAELECDCHLRWLLEHPYKDDSKDGSRAVRRSFFKRKPIRLLGSPTCQFPPLLRGLKLKKVSPTRMICANHSPGVTNVEIDPILDQVVFAGDSLRLQCKVSGRDQHPGKVWWKWGQKHLRQEEDRRNAPLEKLGGDVVPLASKMADQFRFEDIIVKSTLNNGKMESYVEIPEVSWDHSGEWSCMVEGDNNSSRTISIYVIHHDTKYCPANVTSTNKGTYSWPRTVASVKVDLRCQGYPTFHPHSWGASPPRQIPSAEHYCGEDGLWRGLDTSACPYVSETTRFLEQFANTNLSSTPITLKESVKTLHNFTQTAIFKGSDDVSLLTKTLEQYVGLLRDSPEDNYAAQVLADIIGSISSLSKDLLRSAEVLDRSCTRLRHSLAMVAERSSTLEQISTEHLHVELVDVDLRRFPGLSCLWMRKSRHSTNRQFKCNLTNYTSMIEEEVLDARIRIIPPVVPKPNNSSELAMIASNDTNEEEIIKSIRLEFIVHDSANLFPSILENSWKITSPVIGFKIVGAEIIGDWNVLVTLRSAIYSHNILPAWWKEAGSSSAPHGNWTNDGCKVVRVVSSLVSFRCNKQGHFGLLQDMAALYGHKGEKGAPFRLSSPGVYVGSIICCLFLMASIATWSIHHQQINTMSKNKHSFINTWVAILFLVALFTVGIYQTETPIMCQVIGVILHYLTTCVLLWIIVSVTNLYKKVTKTLRPPVPRDDSPSESGGAPPPKPMLRFYLVGWGISLILCGISTAVNLRHYNTYNYCFLEWSQSIAAFYAPSAALVFILMTFFVITQCVLKSSHGGGYSEATGNTETTELELLDAVSPGSENPPSAAPPEDELSVTSQTSSLSLLDGQHSPTTQLRAHVVTLLLFVLSWASAAIATASPFSSIIPYHSTIFSIIYAICSSSLGIFIFVFFCLSRSDVLEIWRDMFNMCSGPAKEDETHLTVANNVTIHSSNESSMPNSSISNQILPPASPALAPSVRSVCSSNTHPTNKSSSVSHSLHPSNKPESAGKASNALHALNFNSFTDNIQYAPEMFYNPKQAGVAKRFFQKQRLKQMMKQNNLEMNRPDSDCNSSTVYCPRTTRTVNSESDVSSFDPTCLGLSNKVNNTNIHVDGYACKQSSKNLTPELLCILGPPKNSCKIVNTFENDQHQWPVTFHFQCSPNSLRKQINNKSPVPPSSDAQSYPIYPFLAKADELKTCPDDGYDRKSPIIDQDELRTSRELSPVLMPKLQGKETRKDKETHSRRHQSARGGKMRQNRPKRKRSRSRGSEKDDRRQWSEDDDPRLITSNKLCSNSLPLGAQTCIPTQRDTSLNLKSASPIPASQINPSMPLGRELRTSPQPEKTSIDYPATAGEMEWLHLLQKRNYSDVPFSLETDGFFCCSNDVDHDHYPTCYSDGESTEGGGECDAWDNNLEITDWSGIGPNLKYSGRGNFDIQGHHHLNRSLDFGTRSSDCETSSVATSLIPGVDTSPTTSLPVSDSPFDSPLHKFHQNTPDSLSLDSGSLLSPIKCHFSSCENPSSINDASPLDCPLSSFNTSSCETPTLTLTISTPVNTPLCSFTPTDTPVCSITHSTSSQEKDLDTLESPNPTPVEASKDFAPLSSEESNGRSLGRPSENVAGLVTGASNSLASETPEMTAIILVEPNIEKTNDNRGQISETNFVVSEDTDAVSLPDTSEDDAKSNYGNTAENDSSSSSRETDV